MKPEGNSNGLWGLRGYSDVYYAVDNYTCKIVTGYIVLINLFVSWDFQIQKSVALSVTEA